MFEYKKNFHSYMKNKTRPERYCRGFDYQKLPIPEKASNGSRLERRKGISSESAFIRNIMFLGIVNMLPPIFRIS